MADDTIRYLFLLSALLIVAAYFVGAATDINALSQGVAQLGYVFTGRNSKGAFAAYPSGATYTPPAAA
jgi:hypothetical protein